MMYAFQGESYESAMKIPIAVRKFFLKRYNQQKALENKSSKKERDVDEPLSVDEKRQMKSKTKKTR